MPTAPNPRESAAAGASGAGGTRDRILDVAEALFASRGYAGAAIRDIAREAQLTPASLYNHFAGKQALYEAVLERGVRPLIELLGGLPELDDTAEGTRKIIHTIMLHLATRPHLPGLVQQEAITGGTALASLARTWIRPMIEHGLLRMKDDPRTGWSEEDHPRVIFAWMNLVFGYFAMAPLMREVLDEDPLAPAQLERQTAFLTRLAMPVMSATDPVETDRGPRSPSNPSTPPGPPASADGTGGRSTP